jgi:hypothetical protein
MAEPCRIQVIGAISCGSNVYFLRPFDFLLRQINVIYHARSLLFLSNQLDHVSRIGDHEFIRKLQAPICGAYRTFLVVVFRAPTIALNFVGDIVAVLLCIKHAPAFFKGSRLFRPQDSVR